MEANFLERIFGHLARSPSRAKLVEVRGASLVEFPGDALLREIAVVRAFLVGCGVVPGDRVALLAPNCARWVCADLGALAAGAIVVPLYDKQAPRELAIMLASARPKVVLALNQALADTLTEAWPEHGRVASFDEAFAGVATETLTHLPPVPRGPEDPVAIIYTSGTSGEPKGVMLSRANVDFMIPKTIERLAMVASARAEDRVFHFLPFCFAASRMMLWTQLSRPNPLMISTDLSNLVQEMATAQPHYYLNVPAVLERIRTGVGNKIRERGGLALAIYSRAEQASRSPSPGLVDRSVLALARRVVFPKIKAQIGKNLEFLISGSAPLAEDTQRWFQMLGLPVYQAYGLTETTGIVSLDVPDRVVAGRVGVPLAGVETRITEEGELLVRGPNVFSGYWEKSEDTARVLQGGWFHTGDQVEIEADNLKIVGRIKNLIIPESGHNIAPEPLEEKFLLACPQAAQCMVVGHARPFVAILVPGNVDPSLVQRALDVVNRELPAYRRIRTSIPVAEGFTAENGLLTANQKLRRAVIEKHFASAIEAAYAAVARANATR